MRFAVLLVAPLIAAFALYDASYLPGYTWNKWGSGTVGTPATVYWSIMPAGTSGSSYCGTECTGASTRTLPGFYDWTTHSFRSLDISSAEGLAYIRNALRAWGAVAGVAFVYVPNDTGLAINDPAAAPPATGHIRIGVFAFACGSAGVGYAAPPNGFYPSSSTFATGAGDLLLNSNCSFQAPAGAEGSHLESFPQGGGSFLNDLEGLLVHELGHTLGLDHTDVTTAVMCAWPADCSYFHPELYAINRQPDADDVAGIQTLYGPPLDTDGDGVPDALDNCSATGNASQLDSDADQYGNLCDADLNNSGLVTSADFSLLRSVLNQSAGASALAAAADMNGSGLVTSVDFNLLRARLNTAPGPSGWH
jgi:hypothetical protein